MDEEQKEKKIKASQSSSTTNYLYFPPLPDNPNEQLIREQMHMLLIAIITAALLMTVFIMAGKFLLSATQTYGELANCRSTSMYLDGWDFMTKCMNCASNFKVDSYGRCQPQ